MREPLGSLLRATLYQARGWSKRAALRPGPQRAGQGHQEEPAKETGGEGQPGHPRKRDTLPGSRRGVTVISISEVGSRQPVLSQRTEGTGKDGRAIVRKKPQDEPGRSHNGGRRFVDEGGVSNRAGRMDALITGEETSGQTYGKRYI